MSIEVKLSALKRFQGQCSNDVIEFVMGRSIKDILFEQACEKWNHPKIPYPLDEIDEFARVVHLVVNKRVDTREGTVFCKEHNKDEFYRVSCQYYNARKIEGEKIMRTVFPKIDPSLSLGDVMTEVNGFVDGQEIEERLLEAGKTLWFDLVEHRCKKIETLL